MQTNNKLREALTRVKKIAASYINCHDDEIDRVMTEIVATCDSALAEPVKNYEVGTAEEQEKRFDKFCDSNTHGVVCSYDCPLRKNKSGLTCRLEWVQLPYEAKEGVAE